MTQDSNPAHEQFKTIYGNGGKLTDDQLQQIKDLDYSNFTIEQIKDVQEATDLPDDLAVYILKNWMRRQDDLLLNLRGNLIYSPEVSKARLQEFVNMMRCPNEGCKKELVVENILEKIATGGGLRTKVPLINPNKFDEGVIRFDHVKSTNEAKANVQALLDFDTKTFYHGQAAQNAFIILGLPPFMKVKLTKYKLGAPPKLQDRTSKGGLKSWALYGSNDWEEIHTGTCPRIHSCQDDQKLSAAEAVDTFDVDSPENDYFRYFKLMITNTNHQSTLEILLSVIDFTGNIIISRE